MKVLVTREIPQAGIDILKEHPEIIVDYRQGPPLSPEELEHAVVGVDAILPVIPDKITADVIKSAGKQLKIIGNYTVGYDNVDLAAATRAGVYVSNTPGDFTEAVAEHSLALMLAVGRKIVDSDQFTRDGKYKYWDPMIFLGPKFMGKTLGIIGFGRIGQHFAQIAHNGLKMKILYSDTKKCESADMPCELCSMDNLLEKSDVISLHCNLTEETKHLIGEKELRKMKPGAILINTARGPVINETALAVALKEGWIEGAGIDVYEQEPKIHPDLLKLHNVVLTPHIASATREARIQMATMAAKNIVEVLINNKPPINLVNKELISSLT